MKKLPVIIERTNTHLRAMPFKLNNFGGNFEQPKSYQFESNDFESQNDELNYFIREHFFENTGIYINVPIEELILREFTLPFKGRSKIKDLLPFELESQLPYEISDIFYDYHAYPDENEEKTHIIVTACRKTFLEKYIQFFLKNELKLKGIYVPGDSLLQLTSSLEEPVACILYMSGNYSIFLIVNQGVWQFSRLVPLGYERLFLDISRKWKKDTQESKKIFTEIPVSDSDIVDFEYYKEKFKLSSVKSKELVELLTQFSKNVNHELNSTLRKFYTDVSSVKNIVLMSDLENQVFLENILSEKISLGINPFPYGRTPISLIGRSFIIPVGMVNAISSNQYLNLLDSNLKKLFKKRKDHSDKLMYAVLFLSFVLFSSSFVINILQKQKHYSIIQKKKIELFTTLFNKKPDDQTSITTQASMLVDEQKKRSEVYKLQSNKIKLSLILYELNKSLIKSSSIQIERFVYSNNIININGNAMDFNEINNIKSLITVNPIFKEIEMKEQRTYLSADGKNRVRFNIIIKPKIQEN
ncbi:MAG: hypothetical protein OEV78_01070 [Spirochaetia bacterium]|nr:hypothetical protein [Spirochaetia bacterium]